MNLRCTNEHAHDDKHTCQKGVKIKLAAMTKSIEKLRMHYYDKIY